MSCIAGVGSELFHFSYVCTYYGRYSLAESERTNTLNNVFQKDNKLKTELDILFDDISRYHNLQHIYDLIKSYRFRLYLF